MANGPDKTPFPLSGRSSHLLLLAVVAFSAGIAAAQAISPEDNTIVLVIALFLAAAILFSRKGKAQAMGTLLLFPFFFLVGLIHAGPYLDPPTALHHVRNQITTRQTVAVSGTLIRAPSRITDPDTGPKTVMLIEAEYLIFPADPDTVRKATGLVRLTLKGEPMEKLTPGRRLTARAQLSPISFLATPGAFNLKTFFARQGLWVSGWITTPANITLLPDLLPGRPPPSHAIRFQAERARYRIARFLDRNLDPRTRGLYKAILIGDKSDIPADIRDSFQNSGCTHLLAISGLHLGLLAFLFYVIFSRLLGQSTWLLLRFRAKKIAALITLFPVTGYAFIAGLNIPVTRALLMAAVVVLALLFDCRKSLLPNLALAAFIVLILHPLSLFSASFQLSFGAVLAIALFTACQPRYFPAGREEKTTAPTPARPLWQDWALAGLLISTVVLVGIAPFLAYHFHRISLLGPLATLLVEPLLCIWSLTIGLAAITLHLVSPAAAVALIKLGSLGLTAGAALCGFLSTHFPWAVLWLPAPTIPEIALYYLFIFALLTMRGRRLLLIALLCISATVGIEAGIQLHRKFTTTTTVTQLDVGQGSSTLIEFPGGRTVLLDGGGPTSARFNVGRDIIAPFLWQHRVLGLDGIIVSHPHADHYNGLPFIIDRFRPDTLWTNGKTRAEPGYKKMLEQARRRGIEQRVAGAGDLLLESNNARLFCLANFGQPQNPPGPEPEQHQGRPGANPNQEGMVLKLETGFASFLFPGDIDRERELKLIEQHRDLKADVLLSPHHGSRTSNSQSFINAVSPEYLLISSGNSHQAATTAARLAQRSRQQGIKGLMTFKQGAITCTADERNSLVCSGHLKTQ
ncbi:MAG: DNA internalization-related competence protein ComEC/Rec2 [Desulfobacterales bacterium]|nr:DNA internalization-related competence protein ComEC/Rec2 [Desulfobacterales bacterium]